MKTGKNPAQAPKKKCEKHPVGGNFQSVIAILIGILIAACGILLPRMFFSKESEALAGRQYTVSVLSSDSVHTVTRDTSFTLEDYAYITKMTRSGSSYYSEPADVQLTMREASNASGEILKALLPNIFTGDVKQSFTLSSAILTSSIQSSEEDYDYRQSFWYVDISYPDDTDEMSVSAAINAVNGKAWTVTATFPVDSSSYGSRVADDILAGWEIDSNLFYGEAEAETENQKMLISADMEEMDTAAAEGEFYAEYFDEDGGVLIYNASNYFDRLEIAVQTMDGVMNFLTDLYVNYLDYLGISAAKQKFSFEILFDYDRWYSEALEECRELVSLKEELRDAAEETNLFSRLYNRDDVDTILLNSEVFEDTLFLLSLVEQPDPYTLHAALWATDDVSGLTVSVELLIFYDEEFILTVSLGMGE